MVRWGDSKEAGGGDSQPKQQTPETRSWLDAWPGGAQCLPDQAPVRALGRPSAIALSNEAQSWQGTAPSPPPATTVTFIMHIWSC